jgi:phosphocarrier protein FPr/phosphocarrier protein
VPDEAFGLLGDGVAIDPIAGTLHAPCDGEVIVLPASRHAVTLRAGALQILLHVGIDTVALRGEGFTAHVAVGEQVRAGQPLLTFDLDLLAQRARSLITPVLVLDGRNAPLTRRLLGQVQVGDFLMEVSPLAASGAHEGAVPAGLAAVVSRELQVALPLGLHARPAGRLSAALARFTAQVSVLAHGRSASARSPTALMTLGVGHGDVIEVRAAGADAQAALAAFEEALQQAAAAEAGHPAPAPRRPVAPDTVSRAPSAAAGNAAIRGTQASPGLALGPAVQLDAHKIEVPVDGEGVEAEQQKLAAALAAVRAQLEDAGRRRGGVAQEIAAAHQGLLSDPELLTAAQAHIAAGRSAGLGWRQATQASVAALLALKNARLAERADDLRDLESQVQRALYGSRCAAALPRGGIVLARELLPSQMAQLESAGISGICLAGGGPTSHVAILAQAAHLPALVAAGDRVLTVPAGTPVLLDADAGTLETHPDPERVAEVRRRIEAQHAQAVAEQAAAAAPGRTADGHRIEVLANVGSLEDARTAVASGAEGVGLLRTEILFLDRENAPSRQEQQAVYQALAAALDGRPVTIRTLDIGGDKPIPYLPLPHEDNPALGLRGVRTSLWKPELLRQQLEAILAVEPPSQCRILLPMITDAGELRTVCALIEAARAALGRQAPVRVGVMIETPAAALLAGQLAQSAEFLSIGTNDLTQYTLAMDRGNPELAPRIDALHPAVLRMIALVVEAGRAHGRPVAVCGAAAGDPEAVPVLIGLGVTELSVVPAFIPRLKAQLTTLTLAQCQALAREAASCSSPQEVRALSADMLARRGKEGTEASSSSRAVAAP